MNWWNQGRHPCLTAGITGFNWQPLLKGIVFIALQRLNSIYLAIYLESMVWHAFQWLEPLDIRIFHWFVHGFFHRQVAAPLQKEELGQLLQLLRPSIRRYKKRGVAKKGFQILPMFSHTNFIWLQLNTKNIAPYISFVPRGPLLPGVAQGV